MAVILKVAALVVYFAATILAYNINDDNFYPSLLNRDVIVPNTSDQEYLRRGCMINYNGDLDGNVELENNPVLDPKYEASHNDDLVDFLLALPKGVTEAIII